MMRCFSCDIELQGNALIAAGRAYCCSGCAAGDPCSCTYEGASAVRPTNGHADPETSRELLRLVNDNPPDTHREWPQ
jgi:hypothetical protein